jgi:tRNA(adenine34) deaminase
MSRDEIWMRAALREALKASSKGEVPVGAVVIHEDRIIARGYNQVEEKRDATAHAELLALRRAAKKLGRWRLTGCTLIVTLEPCAMCAGALVQSRVGRLVFGCRDPKFGACGSILDVTRQERLNHRVEVRAGVLSAESRNLLLGFFRARRKKTAERWPSG